MATLYIGAGITQSPEEFRALVSRVQAAVRADHTVLDFLGLTQGTPLDVYRRDIHECVARCDAFIALCTYPSIGLGYELACAVEAFEKPTLALAEEEASVTRLIQGIDAPHYSFTRYRDETDLLAKIRSFTANLPPRFPFLPKGRAFRYAPESDPFMQEARAHALAHSLDAAVKTGSVIVSGGEIIGRGANGSDYHKANVCERVKRGIPTGQGYELCEGCHPKNHSEPRAIAYAKAQGGNTEGADLYLWGHWWCCEPCWTAIIGAGIRDVYLIEGSERLFNREHPENVLGKW